MDSIETLIQLALDEDIGSGDVTTEAIFSGSDVAGTGRLYAKQDLVVSGLEMARGVFRKVDSTLEWNAICRDGDHLKAGDDLATLKGAVESLLIGERVALNFLQQLSGIATHTARFVAAVAGTGVVIRDTRKTIPGYRHLSKQATAAGGAEPHRMGLYDQYLVKNNHIAAAGSIAACLAEIWPQNNADLKVQVEVRTAAEAAEAVEGRAHSLLLDNMNYDQAKEIAQRFRDQVELEVSGNVNLDNVRLWAETGVHAISIGALTHSAPAVDIAMEVRQV